MLILPDKTKPHFNCLEACVASILSFQNKDHIPIFSHSWRMKYEPIQKDIKLLVEKYCNSEFIEKTFYDYDSFKEYIKVSIQEGNPVIYLSNMFYLPWTEYYKKSKIENHYIIINGYSEEDNIFFVTDFYEGVKNQKLNIYSIVKNFTKSLIQFSILEKTLDITNVFEIQPIQTIIIKNKKTEINSFKFSDMIIDSKNILFNDLKLGLNYKEMTELIMTKINDEIIVSIDEGEDTFYFEYLRWLGRGRIMFSEFLKFYLKDKLIKENEEIIKKLKSIGEKYLLLRLVAMKSVIKKTWQDDYKNSYNQLMEILLEEEKIYNIFLKLK